MTLKTLNSGSDGNCYILTNDAGKHLILDAGIKEPEIKKGLNFEIENVVGAVISHEHLDHSKSAGKLGNFTPVWTPYKDEHKIQHTHLGDFDIKCFDVPHNGTPNKAFIITADNSKILYATDYEYIPYDLSKEEINVALIELNYQVDRISESDHLRHVVLGHAEETTTINFLSTIKKRLRTVILCHMSKSGGLDRELAMKHLREKLPEYIDIQWAKANETYNISEIPF